MSCSEDPENACGNGSVRSNSSNSSDVLPSERREVARLSWVVRRSESSVVRVERSRSGGVPKGGGGGEEEEEGERRRRRRRRAWEVMRAGGRR